MRRIVAALTQRIPELPAPEQRESPQTPRSTRVTVRSTQKIEVQRSCPGGSASSGSTSASSY
jgi:hypothetical protein